MGGRQKVIQGLHTVISIGVRQDLHQDIGMNTIGPTEIAATRLVQVEPKGIVVLDLRGEPGSGQLLQDAIVVPE